MQATRAAFAAHTKRFEREPWTADAVTLNMTVMVRLNPDYLSCLSQNSLREINTLVLDSFHLFNALFTIPICLFGPVTWETRSCSNST